MRLEQLDYLLEIHKTHSINLAAKRLHVSQQNISQSIKNLEFELGAQLLERKSSGTTLTPAGLIALKYAQKITHNLESLKTEVDRFQPQTPELSGELTIMYVIGFSTKNIYQSVERFLTDYPNVKIKIYQKSISTVLNALYENKIDLGLLTVNDDFHFGNVIAPEKMQSLSFTQLAEDPLLAAVSHLSPLSSQKSITVSKLLQYPLMFFHPESEELDNSNYLFNYLSNFGEPTIQLATNAFDIYINAIATGQGIGFLTKTFNDSYLLSANDSISMLSIQPSTFLLQGYAVNKTVSEAPPFQAYLPYLLKQFPFFYNS